MQGKQEHLQSKDMLNYKAVLGKGEKSVKTNSSFVDSARSTGGMSFGLFVSSNSTQIFYFLFFFQEIKSFSKLVQPV